MLVTAMPYSHTEKKLNAEKEKLFTLQPRTNNLQIVTACYNTYILHGGRGVSILDINNISSLGKMHF